MRGDVILLEAMGKGASPFQFGTKGRGGENKYPFIRRKKRCFDKKPRGKEKKKGGGGKGEKS